MSQRLTRLQSWQQGCPWAVVLLVCCGLPACADTASPQPAAPPVAQTAPGAPAAPEANQAPGKCVAPGGTRPAGPTYMLATQADIVALLPPPPAADSQAQAADLQAVFDAQREARLSGTTAHAVADIKASCARVGDVLGDVLTLKRNARVLAFLDKAAADGDTLVGAAKQYWQRPRPYALDARIERLGDVAPDYKPPEEGGAEATANCPPSTPPKPKTPEQEAKDNAEKEKKAYVLAHSSYPSGHTTFGTLCAIMLADMVPEKRAELFARSRDFGHSRLVVGAHYPSDVEAGRITGTVAATLLMQNAKFQHDFALARATLRQAMGLAAEIPDLAPGKKQQSDVGRGAVDGQ
jgi:acid phosphatase (class A)